MGFLKDVARNLNWKKEGYKWSRNSKGSAQTMKMYGGRCMCDFFQLNFARPSYKAIKRSSKKGVQFVLGEHDAIFKCAAKIYK